MELTFFLAKVIGAFLVIVGVSILLKQKSLPLLAEQFINNFYLKYFAGIMALIMGLLLVASHNLWTSPEKIIITLIGWAALLKGASLILLPENTLAGLAKICNNKTWAIIGGLVAIVLGVYLLYIWYTAIV